MNQLQLDFDEKKTLVLKIVLIVPHVLLLMNSPIKFTVAKKAIKNVIET